MTSCRSKVQSPKVAESLRRKRDGVVVYFIHHTSQGVRYALIAQGLRQGVVKHLFYDSMVSSKLRARSIGLIRIRKTHPSRHNDTRTQSTGRMHDTSHCVQDYIYNT